MVLCPWYGDRHEFRNGAPTADGVLLLDELSMMLYDAMDFASEAGYTHFKDVICTPGCASSQCTPPIHSIPL